MFLIEQTVMTGLSADNELGTPDGVRLMMPWEAGYSQIQNTEICQTSAWYLVSLICFVWFVFDCRVHVVSVSLFLAPTCRTMPLSEVRRLT